MPNVQANGMTIEYDMRGEGEPLLLIMGFGGQLIDWPDEFVDLFVEQGFKVIRFDNRDAGLSSQTSWEPPGRVKTLRSMALRRPLKGVGYTMREMAADAVGLLDALGLDSAHVVGASMGGMIAQEMAIDHPDRVRSLCSIMSNTGDRKNGGIALPLLRKLARMEPPSRDTYVEQGVAMWQHICGSHYDPARVRDMLEAAVERSFTPEGADRQGAAISGTRDRTPFLADVTAPTLIVHGLADPLVKPSGGIATAQAIPGSRLLAFPDMGHDMPEPRWPEMRDAIVANTGRAPVQPGAATQPTADIVVGR